jgi:hypothetical protein
VRRIASSTGSALISSSSTSNSRIVAPFQPREPPS